MRHKKNFFPACFSKAEKLPNCVVGVCLANSGRNSVIHGWKAMCKTLWVSALGCLSIFNFLFSQFHPLAKQQLGNWVNTLSGFLELSMGTEMVVWIPLQWVFLNHPQKCISGYVCMNNRCRNMFLRLSNYKWSALNNYTFLSTINELSTLHSHIHMCLYATKLKNKRQWIWERLVGSMDVVGRGR